MHVRAGKVGVQAVYRKRVAEEVEIDRKIFFRLVCDRLRGCTGKSRTVPAGLLIDFLFV
jgi:hypothetical protein